MARRDEAGHDGQCPAGVPLYRIGQRSHAAPRRFVIGGVLPCGEAMLVIGAPKSGKSALTDAAAYSVGTGTAFFGHKVRRGLVVCVPAERYRETERRLEVAFRDADDSLLRLSKARLYADEDGARGLVASILALAEEVGEPPTLVILDTANALLQQGAGDENTVRDINALTNAIDVVREGTGAAVILVHHSKRGEKRSRGSEALEGWAEIIAMVDGKGEQRRLSVIRSNTVEEGVKATFKLAPVDLGEDAETGSRSSVVMAVPTDKATEQQGPKPIRLAPDVEKAFTTLQSLDDPADIEAWRRATYAAFGDRKPGALRNAFHSSRTKLIEHGLVFMVDDHTVSVSKASA